MRSSSRMLTPKGASRLFAILRVARPINCLMIGFAVVVAEFIAAGRPPQLHEAALGSLSAALLMAGTMAINDYFDLETDRINRPYRPLPSGIITPRQAFSVGLAASAVGLSAAASLNMGALTTAAAAFLLMVYYNMKGKRSGFFGNILVSICIGLPFIFGGAAVGRVTSTLLFFSAMAFTANLGREVTKGIVDVDGDLLMKARTVAVIHGSKAASRLAALLYFAAVGLSLWPPALKMVNPLYLPVVLLSDAGFLSSSVSLLRNHDRENAERVKGMVMLWMFIGLLAFIAGSVSV
ncbi:UbiA family prenyltransferase [Candidatus Bathyarchaeota archaeon]|nr:UbiA family prenyltransferase [Candidatus Bathyarchaeota archaeon]